MDNDIIIPLLILLIIVLPLVPGILLWLTLDPITFWQRFAIIMFSTIAGIIVAFIELSIILAIYE